MSSSIFTPAVIADAQRLAKKRELTDEEFTFLCEFNPLWFLEVCCFIIPKEGGHVVPLRLNDEQYEVFKIIWAMWIAGRPVRLIILKARQLGISTMIQALFWWFISTRSFRNGLVVSHELDSSRKILHMAHRLYQRDGRHSRTLAPMMHHQNKNEIALDNPDPKNRPANPGLDSHLVVATADNKNAGHSSTLQAFHGSEVARWPKPDLLSGVMNALAKTAHTMGFLESTAFGASGPFFDIWRDAKKGDNEWTPVFLSWKGRKEYRTDLPPKRREWFGNSLTAHEDKIMAEHGLDLEQMFWRRQTINNPESKAEGRNPEDVFREQFPLTADEAFVSTGKSFFDIGRVMRIEALIEGDEKAGRAPIRPTLGLLTMVKRKGMLKPDEPVTFTPNKGGSVAIWKWPVPGHDYCMGADVGAGMSDGDYSNAYVLDRGTQEVVARFRGLIDTEEYANELVALGWFFNEAFIAVEANGIGYTTAKRVAAQYARSCYKVNAEGIDAEPDPDKPGWYTSEKNRKIILATLRSAFRDGAFTIHCEVFLSEAHTFEVSEKAGVLREDKPQARRRKKDDCILSMAITNYIDQPQIAGVPRKPKVDPATYANWREQELARSRAARNVKKPVYDEHVGRLD